MYLVYHLRGRSGRRRQGRGIVTNCDLTNMCLLRDNMTATNMDCPTQSSSQSSLSVTSSTHSLSWCHIYLNWRKKYFVSKIFSQENWPVSLFLRSWRTGQYHQEEADSFFLSNWNMKSHLKTTFLTNKMFWHFLLSHPLRLMAYITYNSNTEK